MADLHRHDHDHDHDWEVEYFPDPMCFGAVIPSGDLYCPCGATATDVYEADHG